MKEAPDMQEQAKRLVVIHNLVTDFDKSLIYYLAGPMSGYPDFNYPFFDSIATSLRNSGHTILSPSGLDNGVPPESYNRTQSYKYYIYQSLMLLKEADAIILLPDWYYSKGARIELDIAIATEMPVYNLWYVDEYSDSKHAYFSLGVLS